MAYDRIIDSALDLPGALVVGQAASVDWQLALTQQQAGPPLAAGCRWRHGQLDWQLSPSEHYAVTSRSLTIRTCGPVDGLTVSANAIANGLPAMAWIAGDIVLHAAAVVMPQCHYAVAIMAPSGGGKSTVLHELIKAGAMLVADDTLVLRYEDGRWIGSGLSGGWFMRVAGQDARDFVTALPGRSLQRAPMGAIVSLNLSDDPPAAPLVRHQGFAALGELLQHRHRPQVPKALGCEGKNLQSLTRIATQIPIHRLTRQRGRIRLTQSELAAMADVAKEKVSGQ